MRRALVMGTAFVCACGLGSTADAQWTDATSGLLGDTGTGSSVAWGDYDNDGDQDIFLANYYQANKLFRNDGDDAFASVSGGWVGTNCATAGWADYDNDGNLDLYLTRSGEAANRLIRNNGNGNFVEVTSGPEGDPSFGTSIAWGDYDNDGDLDIYVPNWYGKANVLIRNEGDGTFVDATSGGLGDTGDGHVAAWGDYDNDGDLDLYLATTASKLFRNDGDGNFADVTSGTLGDPSGQVAWGDYDNDGDLDLYLGKWNQPNVLFRNDGGGTFVDATSGPLGNAGASRTPAWADYDNDGDLDLYLSNQAGGNVLFRNDGGGVFADATSGPLVDTGQCRGVAWADYDGDGDLDLYVSKSGANKLIRNDGAAAGNHWLHVDLVGTISNVNAIGARVCLVAGGLSQIREVSGGVGSQNSLTVEFGLGTAAVVDELTVTWPSGIVQVVSPLPAVDQKIVVVEQEQICTGTILGAVSDGSAPMAGITVKLLDDAVPTTVVDEVTTNGLGEFLFIDVMADVIHQIMVVEPLGYTSNQNYVARTVVCDGSETADFVLTPFVLVNNARSKGYWKHQFDVYVKNRGHAQETEADLIAYIEEVRDRYTDPHYQTVFEGMADGVDDFEEWQAALSVKGNAGMEAKAMAQLGALALNVMSLKIGQYEVVTEDGRTAGDVLTHVSQLLTDPDASNDELAKDLAESVNHQETIAAGVVPESDIQYARPQVADQSLSVWPNPGGASRDYTISLFIPVSGRASVEIFNVGGRRVATVLSGGLRAGRRQIAWPGRDSDGRVLGQGVYFAKLTTAQGSKTVKFVHLGR